ncbi:MAG TPA: HAD-IA family hydrolase [Anaerolineales bacterium]|jgi:HAD superfamily hydrolase (TIGR01509 family)|nr:HAD-IA family hydrolase [Anaerolineales bacterium]
MAQIKGIFFDQDGVIIDTERDGHRVAFNDTFREFGFPFEWGVDEYHQLLQVAGGKERMKHYYQTRGFGAEVKPEELDDLIARMHKRKTAVFIELIESGRLPLRPGIRRFMKEIVAAGLKIGVCTTSNEKAAQAVATRILADIPFNFVLAGDVVSKKKPDPEIYNLALEKTGLKPDECVVIEDSRNGVLAAKAAGMRVVATTNVYTEKEDLHEADVVLTCLGDSDGEKGVLKQGGDGLAFDGALHAQQVVKYFSTGG